MIDSLYKAFQKWSDGASVWLISDTHFDDDDCKVMNPDWPHPMRFVNIISKYVGRNDTIIHLGDVGNPQYMRHIHCKRKVLLTGNHDGGVENYTSWFQEVYDGPIIIAPKIILSHEPAYVPWAVNIHGHCHCVENPFEYDPLQIGHDGGARLIGFNACADVVGFKPVNLKELIKLGVMKDTPHIHRITIDAASNKEDQGE